MKDTPQILRECAAGDRLLHRKSLLHIADEIERLREALREISTRNFPEGTATLELRKIARAALREDK